MFSPHAGRSEDERSRSRARTPRASDVKQRILFASPCLRGSASLPIQSGPLRAVAEQLFAKREAVRCRPGTVTNSESATIPDQRCTTTCCTASGKRGQVTCVSDKMATF
jgi:hypothetical protein